MCSHTPWRSHTSAIAPIGSTAPVSVVPAVATTATGVSRRPGRGSARRRARRRASGAARRSAPGAARRPSPPASTARTIEWCASSEQYTVAMCPATPCSRAPGQRVLAGRQQRGQVGRLAAAREVALPEREADELGHPPHGLPVEQIRRAGSGRQVGVVGREQGGRRARRPPGRWSRCRRGTAGARARRSRRGRGPRRRARPAGRPAPPGGRPRGARSAPDRPPARPAAGGRTTPRRRPGRTRDRAGRLRDRRAAASPRPRRREPLPWLATLQAGGPAAHPACRLGRPADRAPGAAAAGDRRAGAQAAGGGSQTTGSRLGPRNSQPVISAGCAGSSRRFGSRSRSMRSGIRCS